LEQPYETRPKDSPLDTVQYGYKEEQGEDIRFPDAPDGDELAFHRLHIKHPESDNEESQVTEQEDEPGRIAAPPGII